MGTTRADQAIIDRIAAKLTPEELDWFRSIPETLTACDQLITLNRRLIRWARQDPASRRAVEENLYSLVGEIERVIGT